MGKIVKKTVRVSPIKWAFPELHEGEAELPLLDAELEVSLYGFIPLGGDEVKFIIPESEQNRLSKMGYNYLEHGDFDIGEEDIEAVKQAYS